MEEFNDIYYSGRLCTIYDPLLFMPEDFNEREFKVSEEVEEAAKVIWGEGVVEAEYDTWADTTTRLSLPRNVVSDQFLDFCYGYVAREQGNRYISCQVRADLKDFSYVGSICIYIGGVFVENILKTFWRDNTSKWMANF